MTEPEEQARQSIDEQLRQAGWVIQDIDDINLGEASGIAVREYPTDSGPADYFLFVDKKAIGVVEAKPEGDTLSGVVDQTERYAENIPDSLPHFDLPLRFRYESTGVRTYFTDYGDPEPRQRPVFNFHWY